ncbi:hypothetical protein CF328_g8015 [Tilletia controversa]|nr:hypothetical protein CF328_g8015 [Tilletia controversa]
MPRTSAKQQVLKQTAEALVESCALRRRVQDWLENSSIGTITPPRSTSGLDSESSPVSVSVTVTSSSECSLSLSALSGSDSVDSDSDGARSSVSDMSTMTDSDGSTARELRLIRDIIQQLEQRRVLLERRTPRNAPTLVQLLDKLRDSGRATDLAYFRHLVRVLPPAFDAIVNLISSHEAFKVNPKRPGASAREQTAVALIRSQVLCWASEAEKEEARAWVAQRSGCTAFANGWSMVDGSLIPLAYTPSRTAHPREYFDRKAQYSLNLQAVVLPTTLRFIDYVAGYKGSTQDSRAFAASDIVKQPRKYLDEGEFVWTDNGYGLSEFTCGPYDHIVAAKSPDFKAYNKAVSGVRVRSEHAFGYFKGRFQSMKGLRVQIQDSEDHHRAVQIIVAAMVAHNIALRWDGPAERDCFVDLSGVSNQARKAWHELQEPDAETETVQKAAWARRINAQRRHDQKERKRAAQLSQYRLDTDRKSKAKELREKLHSALFNAIERPFFDTTPESRKADKTEKEYLEMLEKRRNRRNASRGRGRGQSARSSRGR